MHFVYRRGASYSAFVVSLVVSCCFCLFGTASAQVNRVPAGQPHRAVPPTPVPLDHLYWHFLAYQRHLDIAASNQEKQGKDGSWLRDHLQKTLGFSDADFSVLREESVIVTDEVARLRAQAQSIGATDRKERSEAHIPISESTTGSRQLKSLTEDRNRFMNDEIARIRARLGPARQKILEDYLQEQLTNNVKTMVLTPPAKLPGPSTGHRDSTTLMHTRVPEASK